MSGGAWRFVRIRRTLAVLLILGVEIYAYRRYAAFGAQFHFWLHGLLGAWLGLTVLAVLRLIRGARQRSRSGPVPAGFAGHAFSALPDVLFTAAAVLHARWMDVFGLHITAHFLWPAPLLASLALFGLALLALTAVSLGAPRVGALAAASSLVVIVLAVALRTPVPSTLEQVRQGPLANWDFMCSYASGP